MFSNILVLTQKNNIYYKKYDNDKFIKINTIFNSNEQINDILYDEEIGFLFLTNNQPILLNNNQFYELLSNNKVCQIEKPLYRNQRSNNPAQINAITSKLNITNLNLQNNFTRNIEEIRNSLLNYGIINNLSYSYGPYQFSHITNTTRNPYFIIPVQLMNERTLQLVYSSSNLYLQGFINEQGERRERHYYYFRSANLQRINGIIENNTHNLNIDENYSNLIPEQDNNRSINFGSSEILDAFTTLSEITHPLNNYNNLRRPLFYVILATSESLRFYSVTSSLNNMFQNRDIQHNFEYFSPAINNWTNFVRYYFSNSQSNSNRRNQRQNPSENRYEFINTVWDIFWRDIQDGRTWRTTNSILNDYYTLAVVAIIAFNRSCN